MFYTINASGIPFIIIDDLPNLALFIKYSHGFYSEDWLVRALITSSIRFTGISESQVIASLCHSTPMGRWNVPTVDLNNFYVNLAQLQSQNLGSTFLNISTRLSSRIYGSLSEYLSNMVSIDDSNLFPDPIGYHQRQLPPAYRECDYGFFYQQLPFYSEIELISLVSNKILDYEALGSAGECQDELNLIFFKKN